MSPRVSIKIDKFFETDNIEEFKVLIETLNINPIETLSGDPSVFSPVLDNTDDKNLLTYACLLGKINIVKYLISLNVYNSMDNEFYVACYKGHRNVIDYLISQGIILDYESILYAAMGNQLDIVRYLLSLNIPLTDSDIQKCLESPIKNGHNCVTKCLLLHYKGKDLGRYIIMAIIQGNLKMVKLLYPFVDNYKDNKLLIKAVEYNKLEIVKFFVAIGTEYTYKDSDAIQVAAEFNYIPILIFLIDSTDDPVDYSYWDSYYNRTAIETLKKYIQIKESLFKGTLTEKTETECGVCYERMKVREGLIQCKECKKCVHKDCQQKWEYSCIYCRTDM